MSQPLPADRLGARFPRLWTSTALTALGDGVLLVAFPLAALHITRSPLLVAGASVALTVPWFLFAPFAGVLADRLDRRSLLLGAVSARACALAALTAAAGFDLLSLPLLYAAALLLGAAETVTDTSSQTLIPMLVHRDQLRRANGLLHGIRITMTDFAGIPIGGLLAGIAIAYALGAPTVMYAVAAAVVVFGLRGRYRVKRERAASVGADIRSGMSLLWRDPLLRRLVILGAGVNLVHSGFLAVFVVYAVGAGSAMHLTEAQYGLLLGVTGVGPLIGSLLTDRLARRWRPAAVLSVVLVGVAAGTAIPAIDSRLLIVGFAILLGDTCAVVATVLMMALRQSHVPSHILGRVTASYWLFSRGAMPVGAFVSGALAEVLTIPGVFGLLAVVALALVPVAMNVRISS